MTDHTCSSAERQQRYLNPTFFADEDLSAHCSSVFLHVLLQSLGRLSYVLFDYLYGMPFQTLGGLPLVSGFSTSRITVTCQVVREFRQLIGNQVHLLIWACTMLGDQICNSA